MQLAMLVVCALQAFAQLAKDEPTGTSCCPSISDSGDVVVFESSAPDLVADDTDEAWDVFAYERVEHRVVRLSDNDAAPARKPVVSGDGRWVAWYRPRADEAESNREMFWSIALLDRENGATRVVDANTRSWHIKYPPRAPSLSRDGRWLVYLGRDDKGPILARRFDRESGAIDIVSRGNDGVLPDRDVEDPSLSHDGRFVVFCTDALNLAKPTSTAEEGLFEFMNDREHVFVRDLKDSTTRYASDLALKQLGYAGYGTPRISDDGRYVAYNHYDSRKMGSPHVGFVSDLVEREPGRLLPVDKVEWFQGAALITWLSADGRSVLVESSLDLAASGSAKNSMQVYCHDRGAGTWKLLSRAPDGSMGNGWSRSGVASCDLHFVAFASDATNLVEGDSNALRDVFLLDTETGALERCSTARH